MSPEMIRNEIYDSKTDVYSWAVCLSEIVMQRAPYEGLYITPVQVAYSSIRPYFGLR